MSYNKKQLLTFLKTFKIRGITSMTKKQLEQTKALRSMVINNKDIINDLLVNKKLYGERQVLNRSSTEKVNKLLRHYNKNLNNINEDIEFYTIIAKLRKTRVDNKDMGVIIQRPIKNFAVGESYGQLADDKDIKYVDKNFNSIINYALNEILKNKKIIKPFVNIQAYYAYRYIVKENGEEKYKLGVGYTLEAEVFENGKLKNNIVFTYPATKSDEEYINLGYRVKFSTRSKLDDKDSKQFLAFHPSNDRKYHEMTCNSTSTNKYCIYESFLDIIGKRSLAYKHNKNNIEDLKLMLKNEGKEIEESVRKGLLIKSLKLLTLKYATSIIIKFYKQDDEFIIVSKGRHIFNPSEELVSKFYGFKGMLYEENVHVAPLILTKTIITDEDKDKKIKEVLKDKKYKLRHQRVINSNLSKISVYGYDTETYLDKDSKSCVYCITLYGKKYNEEIIKKEFYGFDSLKNFVKYIDQISYKGYYQKNRPKEQVERIFIYGFNNSNFDNLLIYNELYKKNPLTKFIFTNSSVKHIKYNNVSIGDISLFYKAGSLRATCKQFELEEEKGVFPYKFVTKDNLDYIGEVPTLNYWNTKEERDEYIKENGEVFDMETYTLKYCMLDSKLVYRLGDLHIKNSVGEIVVGKNEKGDDVKRKFNLLNCSTGANIALKMFTQVFLEDILIESKESIRKLEKEAYKGGRTEKFKHMFLSDNNTKLHYYDINSSYPYSMTKEMPFKYIKSLSCNLNIDVNDDISVIVPYNLYEATYKYEGNNKHFIPNLLLRENKQIIAVNECDKVTPHWGCELIEAHNNGCSINIKKVHEYEGKAIFKPYVDYFYTERLTVKGKNDALCMFYKLLLNSLYGKFGQKSFTKSQLCKNSNEMYRILEKEKGILLNSDIYDDIIMFEYQTEKNEDRSIGKLVRFSSYIAAESRCNLSRFMLDVGHENVYYCDTDSVFTTKKPSSHLVDQEILGKWKEETKAPIEKAVFIAPKTYYYKTENYTIEVIEKKEDIEKIKKITLCKEEKKAKGIRGENITTDDYFKLMNGEIKDIKQTNIMFFRSFDGVIIKEVERCISQVNNKRVWINNNSEPYKNIESWINQSN